MTNIEKKIINSKSISPDTLLVYMLLKRRTGNSTQYVILFNFLKKSSSNILILRRKEPINIKKTNGKTTFKENIKLSIF